VVREVVDDQARGAPRGRVAQEAVAVAVRTLDGEEGLADAQVPAVDADAGDGHTEVARHEGALGAADHVLDAQPRRHARPPSPPRIRSAVRATSRSSKSCDSAPMIW